MAKSSIGIVGCGAIARAVLRAVDGGVLDVSVAGVTSRDADKARAFLATLQSPVGYLSRGELIEASDIVVEAAGPHVVPDLATATFDAGKSLVLISVGALLDHPEIANQDPYGEGWLIRVSMSDASELDSLLTAEDYESFTNGLS